MKRSLAVIILALLLPKGSLAADGDIGLRGGISIPTGTGSTLASSFSYVDLLATVGPGDGNMRMALGVSCANLRGATYDYLPEAPYNYWTQTAAFAGPQLILPIPTRKTTSLYLLPALTIGHTSYYNNRTRGVRCGIDVGAGLMFPMGTSGYKIEIGSTFSMTNVLKKQGINDEIGNIVDEPNEHPINTHIGFIF